MYRPGDSLPYRSCFKFCCLKFTICAGYFNCVGHFTFKFSIALVFKLNFNFQFQVLCKKLQIVSRVFVLTKSVYYPLNGSLVLWRIGSSVSKKWHRIFKSFLFEKLDEMSKIKMVCFYAWIVPTSEFNSSLYFSRYLYVHHKFVFSY